MLTAEWNIDEARKVWEQEAREEALEEKNLKTVIKMKNEGLADDVIARVTELPVDRIREIHS